MSTFAVAPRSLPLQLLLSRCACSLLFAAQPFCKVPAPVQRPQAVFTEFVRFRGCSKVQKLCISSLVLPFENPTKVWPQQGQRATRKPTSSWPRSQALKNESLGTRLPLQCLQQWVLQHGSEDGESALCV